MRSAREFLKGSIDYAGLFPPASLDMASAVRAYDGYLESDDRDLLGRFIVSVQKLPELEKALSTGESSRRWRLSLIGADDLDQTLSAARTFNDRQPAGATIDTIETQAPTIQQISNAGRHAEEFTIFLEIPLTNPEELILAVASTPANAKMRTGGIVATAIPSAEDVLNFIECCHESGVAFKATAGLHHLVRGEYNLTYERNAATSMMFGYLNIFLGTAFSMQFDHDTALAVLKETETSAFRFDEAGAHWRDQNVSWQTLDMVRDYVMKSFGSCSFDEPVSEARAQGLI